MESNTSQVPSEEIIKNFTMHEKLQVAVRKPTCSFIYQYYRINIYGQ